MLEYQTAALLDLIQDDGLLVMAKGLGMEEIILNILKLYCESGDLALVVGTTPKEEQYFISRLERERVQKLPKAITSDCAVGDRTTIYTEGGVLFVTSRILVVDMLKNTIPTELITAVIVCRAHKVLESSQEAFILRLYRQDNKNGCIKAFSDYPEAFARGFCRVEHIMKNLFLCKLYLWPRFHSVVNNCLELNKPQVTEIRLSLTGAMVDIQTALLDLIAVCVKDLKRCNPTLDLEEVTSENALNEAFDKMIKFQLEPMWHQLSSKTKQLINDLRELRSILINLTQYDCVTFFNLLESLKTYEKVLQNTGWLFLPAAESLFSNARKRIAASRDTKGSDAKKKPSGPSKKIPKDRFIFYTYAVTAIEENPKWLALNEIIMEILEDMKKDPPRDDDRILIVATDSQTCEQIKEMLCDGCAKLLNRLVDKFREAQKGAVPEPSKSRSGKQSSSGTSEESSSGTGILTFAQLMSFNNVGPSDDAAAIDPATTEIADKPMVLVEALKFSDQALGVGQTLADVKPRFVIMYDASLTFVRQLEVYQAMNADLKVSVFWLVYETSAEEQRYLTAIRKEKEAFEMLIRQKGDMVIPAGRDGRTELDADSNLTRGVQKANETVNSTGGSSSSTRRGGGDQPADCVIQQQVIVDMREFRSELPSLIHRRGIDIIPVTLEVGDYILTPDICVERKSVSDLIDSLSSGRLYSQATAMCRYYKRPMLLIEFDLEKPFGFQGRYTPKEASGLDFTSKLILLTIHFPALKILWCSSPYVTAEIFQDIKEGRDQPSAEEAMKITEAMGSLAGSLHNLEKYNAGPRNFLMLMPGVDSKNCNSIMNHTGSLDELARNWSQDKLHKLLENASSAKTIWQSLHEPLKSSSNAQSTSAGSTRAGHHGKWTKRK